MAGAEEEPQLIASGFALGEVGCGARVQRMARVRNVGGRSLTAQLRGPLAADATLAVAGSTFSGPGPHTLPGARRMLHLGVIVEIPMREGPVHLDLEVRWPGGSATARLEGDARLVTLRERVDFGTVRTNADETVAVELHNHAHADVTVEVEAPSAPFSTTAAGSLTVPARSVSPIPCNFAPASEGDQSGTLRVTAPGRSEPLECALHGVGESPFYDAAGVGDDDESAIDDGGTPADPSDDTFQRLYLYVPSFDTTVTLGKELIRGGAQVTHAGYSATTDGHVLLRAWNAENRASLTLQAHDQVWIQSTTDPVYLGAGDEGMWLINEGHTYISSGKGIYLTAGHGDISDNSMDILDHGETPDEPEYDDVAESLEEVKLGWQIANAVMTMANNTHIAMRTASTVKQQTLNMKWMNKLDPANLFLLVPTTKTVASTTMTALSFAGVLPAGAINAFSTGGVLAATWGHTAIYGGTGVSIRSLNTAVLGLVNASYDALVSTGMFGFVGAGVSSMTGVTVESALKTQVGAGSGALEIKGPNVTLTGGRVIAQGGSEVSMAAPIVNTNAGVACSIRANEALLSSDAGEVTIAVGTKYGIQVSAAGIMVGSLAGTVVDPSKPHLKISPAGVEVNGAGVAMASLSMKAVETRLGTASSYLSVTPAMCAISSARVDVG